MSFILFLLISFLGGVVALFSPCSGALLPAFFAYAFQTKSRLVLATTVFFLGLSTTAVPIGVGAAFLVTFLLDYGDVIFPVIGILLVALGGWLLAGQALPRLKIKVPTMVGSSFKSIYFLGFFSGLALGTCSGPVLGAIATLAASVSGSLVQAGLLMLAYTFGMTAPLFMMAYAIERGWMAGGIAAHKHLATYFSGGLLIVLGLLFVFSRGSIGGIHSTQQTAWFDGIIQFQEWLVLLLQ